MDIPPFTLMIGPLAGSSGAVRLSVQPWEPVVTIRANILDATAAALGPSGVVTKPHGFRPHIGIAYCNSSANAQPIVSAVEELRHLSPARAGVSAVALVELRREGRAYLWDTVARLPLSGLAPSGLD